MANLKTAGENSVRSKIEQRLKQVEDEQKRDLLKRRIELARTGASLYQAKKFMEAVQHFHAYLKILEDWKGIPRGELAPHVFDLKKDLNELILVSGVYWDLVKLYDRSTSKGKQSDFKHYLDKYVLFSKGFAYQPLAAEALRKYIANGKPTHRAEFKAAYQTLTGEKCFIATSLMDVCHPSTLPELRKFRDERLLKHAAGRVFVRWYYRNGAGLARQADRSPHFIRVMLAKILDLAARRIW